MVGTKNAEVIRYLRNVGVDTVLSIWIVSDEDALKEEEKLAEKITDAVNALSVAIGIKNVQQAAEQIWEKINALGVDSQTICTVIPIEFLASIQATLSSAGKSKVIFISTFTKRISPIPGIEIKRIKDRNLFEWKHGKIKLFDEETGKYSKKLCA